jgi:hypothetical protein
MNLLTVRCNHQQLLRLEAGELLSTISLWQSEHDLALTESQISCLEGGGSSVLSVL